MLPRLDRDTVGDIQALLEYADDIIMVHAPDDSEMVLDFAGEVKEVLAEVLFLYGPDDVRH